MTEIRAAAVLFDLDGTLVDSTPVVERVWTSWSIRHGIDPAKLLAVSHGRPARETMLQFAPYLLDVEEEVAAHIHTEELDTEGLVPVRGARELIQSLPAGMWAIVTSCPPRLAEVRWQAGGIPAPPVVVTSADVLRGKPDPECYLLAADRLGVRPAECLVVEDAPAGIAAALTAGMRVLALSTTYPPSKLEGTWIRPDLTSLRLRSVEDELVFSLSD